VDDPGSDARGFEFEVDPDHTALHLFDYELHDEVVCAIVASVCERTNMRSMEAKHIHEDEMFVFEAEDNNGMLVFACGETPRAAAESFLFKLAALGHFSLLLEDLDKDLDALGEEGLP
jgi:hypothetical protein